MKKSLLIVAFALALPTAVYASRGDTDPVYELEQAANASEIKKEEAAEKGYVKKKDADGGGEKGEKQGGDSAKK